MTIIPKRKGRGKSEKTLALVDAARQILEEIHPASVRAVCYRLFVLKLIPDMGKNSTGGVSKQLVWAREQGIIPWEWIVDETREAERVSTWDNPEQIIRSAVKGYRKDYWTMQPRRVEVWSEKGTVRGTVAPVLHEHGVTFRVMHGYGSATSIYGIAQETLDDTKPLTILYIGDWDCSGMNMSEVDLPKRMERYGGEATIERIALEAADVGPDTKLPWFHADDKVTDSRYEWFVSRYGKRCWEVDALSPVVLRQRLADRITALLDIDAWNRAIDVERAETESMREIMSTYQSILRPAAKYSDGGN